MTRLRLHAVAMLVVAAAVWLSVPISAQGPQPAPPRPPVPPQALPEVSEPTSIPRLPDLPSESGPDRRRYFERKLRSHPVVRIGESYTLAAGDQVRDVTVIGGDAVIEGSVLGDVTVIFGTARLAGTARVDGSFVSIGGGASIAEGAAVRHEVVVIAGTLDAPPAFSPGGDQVLIGGGALGGPLRHLGPWLTRGAMWGRLIVPDISWMWTVLGIALLLYLLVTFVFERPVRACAVVLEKKPLTAAGSGLLVLLLTGPVLLLMTISIVGLIVIPFALCALVVAWFLGSVGAAQWIGMSILRRDHSEQRLLALLSVVLGFVVLSAVYMVPVLGVIAWATIGILGLGSAVLAFIEGYQQERPERPVPPPPPIPPVISSATSASTMPSPSIPAAEQATVGMPSAVPAHMPHPPQYAEPPFAQPGDASALLTFPHASFRDRFCAFALDVILILFVWSLLDPDNRGQMFFALLLAYHIGAWTWKQTTLGGIICQLRLVRVDGAPLGFAECLVRGLSAIFSLLVVGLGCLWILRDPERQAWHDKIAGTYVVKVPRHWKL